MADETLVAASVPDALLFEGYLLYPYGGDALKNRFRSLIGALYPPAFCAAHSAGDASALRLECLAVGAPGLLAARLRFLELAPGDAVAHDVTVSAVPFAALAPGPLRLPFERGLVHGELELAVAADTIGAWRVRVDVRNESPLAAADRADRPAALRYALASPHVVVTLAGGRFVSLIDPPVGLRAAAASCRNEGTWPVLLGPPGRDDSILGAPIILYDHPQLAPESPGDFFDSTDIDELLTLRVLTLTSAEKERMAESDPRARAVLERTERLGLARLRSLHGTFRSAPQLAPGTPVIVRPRRGGDVFDVVLAGRRATVVGEELDVDGGVHVAVTFDDDPGRDLGLFAHRFFFRRDELSVLDP